MLLQPSDRPRPDLFHEPVDDLDAGEVALVRGAIKSLTGKGLAVERAVGIAIEEAADLVFKFPDPFDCGRDQRPGELLVRQPLSALDCIHEVAFDRVPRIERDIVATLNHARAAAFAQKSLGRDSYVEFGIGLVRVQRRK